MPRTVLHILSQRPGRTGSGITLDSLVRRASANGWDQHVLVGTTTDDPHPPVGGLPAERVRGLVFGSDALPIGLPGMSDVMPYESRRFSSLTQEELARYLEAWKRHVSRALEEIRPDVIHSHHIWLLSSLLKELAPDTPVVTHCHGTGFRQMELCPHLTERVRRGCSRNEAFCVLHTDHARRLAETLEVAGDRIHVVGAGYREDLFHARGRRANAGPELVYAGKLSRAKGLPSLLDAVERLLPRHPDLVLHVAGDGGGDEAAALRRRMETMGPQVRMHGALPQADLAELLRRSRAFVLPSMYEGLPLVLVEAAACGCEIVCTALPGVLDDLAEPLGSRLTTVPLPPMRTIDEPDPDALPAFAERLSANLTSILAAPHRPSETGDLSRFTWRSVFERVERTWISLVGR